MTFKAGRSGNPYGRPKGVKDKRAIFREMVEPSSSHLISKAVSMALDGNEAMLRLLLDRILPAKLRDDLIKIDITSDSLSGKAEKIIKSLSGGDISPAVAKTLMDTVATEARILEHDVLEKRVTEIEQAAKYRFPASDWVEE